MDTGVYPETEDGLKALVSNPDKNKYENYPTTSYYKVVPKDAWGTDFVYVKTADKFDLVSLGEDKQKGGNGKDIYYSGCE